MQSFPSSTVPAPPAPARLAGIARDETEPAGLVLVGSWRDFPIPRDLHGLAVLLVSLDYTGPAADAVLEFAHRYGTVQGCAYVDFEHRDALEESLPMAPYAEWAAFEHEVWTTTEPVRFDDAGCCCPHCESLRVEG